MDNLRVTEYRDIRVLTTQQIAEVYGTEPQVITNNFNRNKDRYIEGKHFVCLTGDELKEFKTKNQNDLSLKRINQLYLWTEKGAFLHAKSLNTDVAWEVYDRLVDSYFNKPQKRLTDREMMRIQLEMYDEHEERITHLENTMNLDYGQQQALKKEVNKRVVNILGGKKANAYHEMGKKVFTECNRDIQEFFDVNSRNNIPRLKFEAALDYARHWEPSNNTRIAINDCNAQISLGDAADGGSGVM